MFDFKKIESFAPFCISCLGRAVGRVGFGLDNRAFGNYVLPICRDGHRPNIIPSVVAPEWGATILVEEVDLGFKGGGASGDVFAVRRNGH